MVRRIFRDVLLLFRVRVSCMVGASALFGYLLARPRPDAGAGATVAGVMLLAFACSAWNQAQEHSLDALMERTAQRPVAAGRLRPGTAVCLGLLCFFPAFLLLHHAGGFVLAAFAPAIGIAYNGVYTPLKKLTGFALLAGAAVGALPPVLGWLAGGGSPADPLLALVYGMSLLWQIPHFWLRADRRKAEYQRAGLPLPGLIFDPARYTRLLRLWLYSFAVAVILIPAFPLLESQGIRLAVAVTGMAAFAGSAAHCRLRLTGKTTGGSRAAFLLVDGTMFLVLFLLLFDRLIILRI